MNDVETSGVVKQLLESGFAYFRDVNSECEFNNICSMLGKTANKSLVKFVDGSRSYLQGKEKIPFHTDHPSVNYIAWRCVRNESVGINLIDFREFLHQHDYLLEKILNLELKVPNVDGLTEKNKTKMIEMSENSFKLYYAPWLPLVDKDAELLILIAGLLDSFFFLHHVSVPMEPNSVLIVNNHRILHGRDELSNSTIRLLDRRWIIKHHDHY